MFFIASSTLSAQIDEEIVFVNVDKVWAEKVSEKTVKLEAPEATQMHQDSFKKPVPPVIVKQPKKKSQINIAHNEVVQAYIDKYASYSWLDDVLGLYDFYEPLFVAKLKEYGLPEELKYLPIVESAMNPVAKSHAGAMGLWQFMPATGNEYGLVRSKTVNTFFDPVHSTDAACRYLKFLYKLLGDWNLVLSAYNSGQGTVLKAIKKAGSKEYWKVRKYLPSETKAYTPSYHAVKYVSENRANYGISAPSYFIDYSSVKIIKGNNKISLVDYANKKGKQIDVLLFLNPQVLNNTSNYFYVY